MIYQKGKDKIWVQYQGKIYGIKSEAKNTATGIIQDDSSTELVAPFSCKILKILVNKNQSIKKGDEIIVVEAMKMEYTYTSPRDGVIAEVLVQAMSIVPEGTHFVRWDKKI